MTASHNVHASAVAFGPHKGVLILGASGAGKSQLALALISEGAQLVADDQVLVTGLNGKLFARAPRPIEGMIEARGIGLLTMSHRRMAQIVLILDLDLDPAARLPAPEMRVLKGVTLPCLPAINSAPFSRGISRYISHWSA